MSQPKSNSLRPKSSVTLNLEKKLTAYIAAASAAGVGMAALTPSAEAKVVYTPTNVVMTTSLPIDLNNDGIVDFSLALFPGYNGAHRILLDVTPQVAGNGVRSNGAGAACGFFGVPVGPGEKFGTNSYYGHGVFMAGFFQYSHSSSNGAWANVTNRYLGFKFLINGQVHYGWARVSVTNQLRTVILSGYAYETTPDTTIIEGHTHTTSASNIAPSDLLAPNPQPATLGMLARGADALALWRREDDLAIQ
jgi:hypothetical protein